MLQQLWQTPQSLERRVLKYAQPPQPPLHNPWDLLRHQPDLRKSRRCRKCLLRPGKRRQRVVLKRFLDIAEKEPGVAFVGRLASYKYFNMDQAILNALEMFDNLKENGKLEPKRAPADFGPGDGPK